MPEEILETPQPVQPVETKSTDWPKIILATVLGFGLLAGSAYVGYWYGTQQIQPVTEPTPIVSQPTTKPTPTPEPTTPPITDPTAGWETFTDVERRFSFRYPPTWEMNKVRGRMTGEIVSFDFWGPTQKPNTELYDGIAVIFAERENTEDLSSKEYALKENPPERDTGVTESEETISVGGRTGYKLVVSGLGKSILIYLPLGNKILEIIIFGAIDNAQYSNQYNQILSTFKFLD